mmetsp:Transcript_94309/g.166450  ORF Transcript_94309/g.166450 Transcript_94309/m.166450 type:complete len:137 (-) Transcript_94309:35-445(-)
MTLLESCTMCNKNLTDVITAFCVELDGFKQHIGFSPAQAKMTALPVTPQLPNHLLMAGLGFIDISLLYSQFIAKHLATICDFTNRDCKPNCVTKGFTAIECYKLVAHINMTPPSCKCKWRLIFIISNLGLIIKSTH